MKQNTQTVPASAAVTELQKDTSPQQDTTQRGTAQNDVDALLTQVIRQAEALGIPVSTRIDPHVRLNTRAKTRFGCCKGNRTTGFIIEIAAALLTAEPHVCMQVLAHEVLHTCRGCQDHGERWKAYAAQMNAAYGYAIRRTDKAEQLGVRLPPRKPPQYRWRIICIQCGKQYLRQKESKLVKHPGRYRCSDCGGVLRVEKLL